MRAALDQISIHLGPLHQQGWKTQEPGQPTPGPDGGIPPLGPPVMASSVISHVIHNGCVASIAGGLPALPVEYGCDEVHRIPVT